MRLLVAEYEHSGHHFEFLSYLLPALLDSDYRVTVAITDDGYKSSAYKSHLKPFADRFDLHSLGRRPAGSTWSTARRRLAAVAEAVRAAAADHVLLPSADSVTFGYLFGTRRARSILRSDISCAVCLHSGPSGMRDHSIGQLARGAYAPVALKLAPWQRLNFLNPLVYGDVFRSYPGLRSRLNTIPSPVPPGAGLGRHESRRALGIPEDGRYVVLAGGLSLSWKGVDRLLDAFGRARVPGSDRLLLAGSMGPSVRALLDDSYARECATGEIVTIDKFLTDDEISWAIAAADLVAVPYPRFQRVSGILLRAVAAGRPVLTDDCGWLGHVTRRFQLGWTCDVKDAARFPENLSAALQASADYSQTDAAGLFRRYHTLENFQQHWLREIRILAGLPTETPQVTWAQLENYPQNVNSPRVAIDVA